MFGLNIKLLQLRNSQLVKSQYSNRPNTSFKDSKSIGIIFTSEGKTKFNSIKAFVKSLQDLNKNVDVLCFVPKNEENHEFKYDYFSENNLTLSGIIESEEVKKFEKQPFDYLYLLDFNINPFIMNVVLKSNAVCRVGFFSDESSQILDFMINASGNDYSREFEELLKYTKDLNHQ
ncbi:DUF6913 domain-containing protein [Marinigracilibium pacificum]|uniref:Uncharacterized protein n=1 Tax=Marinigracilibium pacificum TaxID=2729599 RepID=A0A848IXL3_9BACT|nr:hypothetical protein [Marinigracilibium pacificum]NMM48025.1 hypothetical protein [Marinigracilibium pacificum]